MTISIVVNASLGFNPIGPHPITSTPTPERKKKPKGAASK